MEPEPSGLPPSGSLPPSPPSPPAPPEPLPSAPPDRPASTLTPSSESGGEPATAPDHASAPAPSTRPREGSRRRRPRGEEPGTTEPGAATGPDPVEGAAGADPDAENPAAGDEDRPRRRRRRRRRPAANGQEEAGPAGGDEASGGDEAAGAAAPAGDSPAAPAPTPPSAAEPPRRREPRVNRSRPAPPAPAAGVGVGAAGGDAPKPPSARRRPPRVRGDGPAGSRAEEAAPAGSTEDYRPARSRSATAPAGRGSSAGEGRPPRPAPSASTRPAPASVTSATAAAATAKSADAPPPALGEDLAGSALLAAVSRTFALSIKELPEPLRQPIGLGYLLARALDTIADAPVGTSDQRLQRLRSTFEMIKYLPDPAALRALEKDLVPKLTHPGEQALLRQLGELLAWLPRLPADDRWDLVRTLGRISYGQELDLLNFGDRPAAAARRGVAVDPEESYRPGEGSVRALETAEQLQDYAYLVAGSAGEFWTRLCARHLPDFAKLPEADMVTLGRRLGQGLQLVNVLRDLRGDLALGRCYLPQSDLGAAGLTPADLLRRPDAVRPILARWREIALEHLDSGWRYVTALRSGKLRYACALPVLLAMRTLVLLARHSPLESAAPPKVSRPAVRLLMATASVGVFSTRLLDVIYQRDRKKAAQG